MDSMTVCAAGFKNNPPEGHLYNARIVMNHDGYVRLTVEFFAYLKWYDLSALALTCQIILRLE